MEVFSVKKKKKKKNKKVEKIEQKKKDILKVKINNFDLDIQMATDTAVTLLPKHFWGRVGKPSLRKSILQFRQFDGSVIKTLGYFEDSLELDKFEVIPIIVTTYKKNHGLLGNGVLNINSTQINRTGSSWIFSPWGSK